MKEGAAVNFFRIFGTVISQPLFNKITQKFMRKIGIIRNNNDAY